MGQVTMHIFRCLILHYAQICFWSSEDKPITNPMCVAEKHKLAHTKTENQLLIVQIPASRFSVCREKGFEPFRYNF